MPERDWHHQPALDGVRAVAVAAVLVFHGRPDLLPGGFLGVDVFFVLSGFLITGLLLAERRRTGTVRLAAFWGRRARRLLPALIIMLVAVVTAARHLLPADELPALRVDTLAALGYVANWRMIFRGGDYFARTAPASPLQHTWSLGIEEQFYLLWPVLVVLALRLHRPRPVLLAGCAAGTAAAALLSAALYRPGHDPARVYYGTDTRAGALLAGCALALLLAGREPPVPVRRLLAVLAVPAALALGAALALAHGDAPWLYRGGLTAVALTVAVLLGHLVTAPSALPARVLSLVPVAWFGRISYGVYLWHWPLFAALDADRTGLTGTRLFAVRVAATVAVAAASYYLVELPIRRGYGRRLVPAALAAVATAAGLAVVTTVPPPGAGAVWVPRSVAVPAPAPAPTVPATPPPDARPGRRPGAEPRVAILGDSVAWSLGEYLLPVRDGLGITNRGVQGCGIARLPDIWYEGSAHTNYPGCTTWDRRWQAAVDTDDPDLSVILLDRWELMDRRINGRYQHLGDPDFDAYVTGELTRAIAVAGSRGARVVLLTAPYTRRAERPDGGLYPEDTPARVDAWNALLEREAAIDPAHPAVLDLNRVVCPDGRFTWTVSGVRVRSDGLHLTPAGVQRIVAQWLLPRLTALATAA